MPMSAPAAPPGCCARRACRALAITLGLFIAAGAAATPAQPVLPLPPDELVLRAIDATPEVQAATAGVVRAAAEARMRDAGSHELTLGATGQRRRVQGEATYPEWGLDVSRTLRLPGKARLDHEIGAQGEALARFRLEDAHHGAARRVLSAWTAWQRAAVDLAAAGVLAEAAERDLAVVDRRVGLGEAARQEAVAAAAAAAQAGAARQRAQAEATRAELVMAGEFPTLVTPSRPLPGGYEPPELAGSDADWIAAIVSRSHEIDASRALLEQKRAESSRAQADRTPDPTVGVRALSEFGGRERAYGLVFSIPLAGSYRRGVAAAAAADAASAGAGLAATRRDVERDARIVVAAARTSRTIWASEQQALAAAAERARLAARAYALGEAGITELLAARRMEQEALQAEGRAVVDALEAVARVRIDAHELWAYPDEDETSTPGPLPALPAF